MNGIWHLYIYKGIINYSDFDLIFLEYFEKYLEIDLKMPYETKTTTIIKTNIKAMTSKR